MIANGYTEDADMIRATLEKSQDPVMEFKAWGSVLEETRQLHLSWLEVTRDRLKARTKDIAEAQQAEAPKDDDRAAAPRGVN